MVRIHAVDLLAAATNIDYLTNFTANLSLSGTAAGGEPALSFLSFSPAFADLLTPNASARLLHHASWDAFHEAGVYHRPTDSLYLASNWDEPSNPMNVTILNLTDYSFTSARYPNLYAPNGGTLYFPPGNNGSTDPLVLFCDEGSNTTASQLVAIDPLTGKTNVLVDNFLGQPFSSLNDVRQHPLTGHILFTDADYGYYQDFRPTPVQKKMVYSFDPRTGAVSVLADGFDQANGLELSPDLRTLYVTDTGKVGYGGVSDSRRPSDVYAFDLTVSGGNGTSQLAASNRRLFAHVVTGVPDGLHADTRGNVWVSVGDGVAVYDPAGTLLGKLWTGKESNNLAFLEGGRMVVFGNAWIWLVEGLAVEGREVQLDWGY